MKPLPVIAVLVAFVCADVLLAQGPAPVRFRTLGLDVAPAGLHYASNGADVAVGVVSDSRSEFYAAPAANPVVFYRINPGADGTPVKVPVAQADLSSGGSMPLLVFSADPAASDKLRIEVLKDDPGTFPGGSFRILNRSVAELSAVFAKQATAVPAASDRIIEPRPAEGMTTVFFQLLTAARRDRGPIYSNNWAMVPGVRTLVVVTPAVNPQSPPNVRRISESVALLLPPANLSATPQ